jgi:hypothetical protein
LLTDGEDDDPRKVEKISKTCGDNTQINTFGIGGDCSVDLVTKVAKNGRGICNLVADSHNLRPKVI